MNWNLTYLTEAVGNGMGEFVVQVIAGVLAGVVAGLILIKYTVSVIEPKEKQGKTKKKLSVYNGKH